jgi:hypothetical protein
MNGNIYNIVNLQSVQTATISVASRMLGGQFMSDRCVQIKFFSLVMYSISNCMPNLVHI